MRIISGKYKGRQIHPPGSIKARPTTDYAKEGLFNVLANLVDMEELDVLDLFAGTGSIGYEFISRGASSVVFVDHNDVHYRFIRTTLEKLGMENGEVFRSDIFRFLANDYRQYDIIFADPPYDLPRLSGLPDLIFGYDLLKPGGYFILEHGKSYDFQDHPSIREMRKYGNVHFSTFERT